MIDISGDRPAGPVDRSISTGPGTPSIQFFLARAQAAQLVDLFISGDAVAKRGARTAPHVATGTHTQQPLRLLLVYSRLPRGAIISP